MSLIRRVCMEWNRVTLGTNGRKSKVSDRKHHSVVGISHFIVGNKIVMTESHPVTWYGFIYHILLVKKHFLKQAFTLN